MKGYFKKDCPKRKNKPKHLKNQSGDTIIVEEEVYESISVCIATNNKEKCKWILDLGCTIHMSPFIDCFIEERVRIKKK